MLCYFMERYMFSLCCLLEIMMRWNMHHESGVLGFFICLTSRESPLSSYEVRFLVFPQKHMLAKLGGFFRNVIQGNIPEVKAKRLPDFKPCFKAWEWCNGSKKKLPEHLNLGKTTYFPKPCSWKKPKLMDQKFSPKNKSINLNSMANLTSNC